MQLDLLYSFLLSAWTDTRRFRLQIHRYTCVCFYTAWRKGQWLALHGYPGWRVRGLGHHPVPVPVPTSSLGHTFQIRRNRATTTTKKKQQRIKRNKQLKLRVTAENVHTFLRFDQRRAEVVVPFLDSGCRLGNTVRQIPPPPHKTPQTCPITRQGGRLASHTRPVPLTSEDEISSEGDRRSGCSVLEVARFSFGQSCGIGLG